VPWKDISCPLALLLCLLLGHHEVRNLLCCHDVLPHHWPTAMEQADHGLKPLKPRPQMKPSSQAFVTVMKSLTITHSNCNFLIPSSVEGHLGRIGCCE
jgi:hypothetical protein